MIPIPAHHAASRALLKRLGFEEIGIHWRHGLLNGCWRDCVIVERLLNPPRKVTYFEPVPPRLSRNTVIESTFEVGRRFHCTMRNPLQDAESTARCGIDCSRLLRG